jgi:hypothetical protein
LVNSNWQNSPPKISQCGVCKLVKWTWEEP